MTNFKYNPVDSTNCIMQHRYFIAAAGNKRFIVK